MTPVKSLRGGSPLPLAVDRDSALPIAVQLRDQLTWLIATHVLAPGDRLPSIRDLAASLGIHHHTVRGVYDELKGEGLIAVRHGSGAIVEEFSSLQLARPRADRGIATVGVLIAGYNPFYLPLLRGVDRATAEMRSLAIVSVTDDNPIKARLQIHQLVAAGVRGIIAASIGQVVDAELATDGHGQVVPIVYCDQPDRGQESIVFDALGAGLELAGHLASHGRRHLSFVVPSLDVPNMAELYAGFQRAVAQSVLDGVDVVEADGFDIDAGIRAGRTTLARRRKPTAIATASDELAIGVLAAARDMHIDVPGQLSVVGYGEIDAARHVDPALTTVSLPAEEMGLLAGRRLAELIRGGPSSGTTRLAVRLDVRQSCGHH
jgi:DNA-binding LacI/PurR family transcriptional regulator